MLFWFKRGMVWGAEIDGIGDSFISVFVNFLPEHRMCTNSWDEYFRRAFCLLIFTLYNIFNNIPHNGNFCFC